MLTTTILVCAMVKKTRLCFKPRASTTRIMLFLAVTTLVSIFSIFSLNTMKKQAAAVSPMPAPTKASRSLLPSEQVHVNTSSGLVRGTFIKLENNGVLVRAFLGIPFGSDTGGENRFRRPVPVAPWNGTYNAAKKRPPCVQESYNPKGMHIGNANTTEDCLHLNIWAPVMNCNTGFTPHGQCSDKKVVMMYIYGGSFMHGGNSYFFYDGRYITGFGDVIVVVPNYRLGVLGFLNAGVPDAPGNVALHDQILALKWVKRNIAAFGGDPLQVVLFGQSAGAISVGYLQLSPLTRHLFKRAILQSCSALVPMPDNSNDTGIENMKAIAAATNCSATDTDGVFSVNMTLECLRGVEAKKLASIKIAPFYPSFHDQILNKSPATILKMVETFDGKDILLGNTMREGDMMFESTFRRNLTSGVKLTMSAIARAYKFIYRRTSFSQALLMLAHMHGLYDFADSTYRGFRDAIGDVLFNCPTKLFADIFTAKKGHAFYYVLAYRPSFSVWDSPTATHSDDVSLIFGLPFLLRNLSKDSERRLSLRLIKMWTTFAKTGKVYGEDGKMWPAYESGRNVVVIDLKNQTYLHEFRARHCSALADFIMH
ncbi:acetylcholinesterase-like [Ornithodoros turicata]|uniref:acetylcholinesterase-like n=1 Tax=Ornithodoros turicata TaxID=34597 RepID=UPI0031396471